MVDLLTPPDMDADADVDVHAAGTAADKREPAGHDENGEERCCPLCSETFAEEATLLEREIHINHCLDDAGKDPVLRRHFRCPICGSKVDMGAEKRVQHVKACGKAFGVRPQDLRAERALASASENDDPNAVSTSPQAHHTSTNNNNDLLDVVLMECARLESTGELDMDRILAADADADADAGAQTPKRTRTDNPPSRITQFFPRDATRVMMNSAKRLAAATSASKPHQHQQAEGPRKKGTIPLAKRIPDTPLLVDAFEYADASVGRSYLLSHFHSDHTVGLTRAFKAGVIFCTEATARLVVASLGVAQHRVVPLRLNQENRIENARVVAIDANHCPGSCMFLVKTPSGKTHLHTGDCRWCVSSPSHRALLERLAVWGNPRIDTLLLDTTYCDARFDFSSQERAIADARAIVATRGSNPRTLVVFGSYVVGKERLALGCVPPQTRLGVTREKMRVINMLGFPLADLARFSADRATTRFWLVGMHELRLDAIEALLKRFRPRFDNVLAVRPTGWARTVSVRASERGDVIVACVPYSEHSSFSELRDMVRVLSPRVIVPTVASSREHADAMVRRLTSPPPPRP